MTKILHFKKGLLFIAFLAFALNGSAAKILIQMDDSQKNHMKAYGIAYWILQNDIEVQWLLNYKGGSFLIDQYRAI
ncbi:MAG TPA: hypothetical protein VJ949_06150, partial [Cryomorphaceae bacterium]|nr:hypothetical protein [Cryomorphaceae bacterium]